MAFLGRERWSPPRPPGHEERPGQWQTPDGLKISLHPEDEEHRAHYDWVSTYADSKRVHPETGKPMVDQQ
jgi:hypothetical protein